MNHSTRHKDGQPVRARLRHVAACTCCTSCTSSTCCTSCYHHQATTCTCSALTSPRSVPLSLARCETCGGPSTTAAAATSASRSSGGGGGGRRTTLTSSSAMRPHTCTPASTHSARGMTSAPCSHSLPRPLPPRQLRLRPLCRFRASRRCQRLVVSAACERRAGRLPMGVLGVTGQHRRASSHRLLPHRACSLRDTWR